MSVSGEDGAVGRAVGNSTLNPSTGSSSLIQVHNGNSWLFTCVGTPNMDIRVNYWTEAEPPNLPEQLPQEPIALQLRNF